MLSVASLARPVLYDNFLCAAMVSAKLMEIQFGDVFYFQVGAYSDVTMKMGMIAL